MKFKYTLALSAAMTASAFAGESFESLHPGGYAIQIGPGFFAPAYYAKNNAYTVGIESFTASFIDNTNGTEDNSWGIGPFARFNIPLTNHTTIGPALYYAKYFGSVGAQTKEYMVQQYFNLEYAGTKNILIAASLKSVKYTQYNRDATTKNYQIDALDGGSLQITYKF
ncbi:MAG: hypothetical protein CMF42_01300 [Legionellales bacterium]|nr:hypothetical protein [Legionellales bacterium]|tara:strand:- start:228 stop:731 length:504 start_codon:yes stop_codon:yes gene_type:complete